MTALTPLATAWADLRAHCLTDAAEVSLDPNEDEVHALIADLDHFQRRAISLIRAYGTAMESIPYIDKDYVQQAENLIADAISELTGDLNRAAEHIAEDARELVVDRRGWSRAHAIGVG